ncbi:hypothetical protein AN217_07285 [Streptomyces qinglanensis]|uniref:Uncharacterized protein n=1 Tax=Streptomyces qinglanensis TaxID=943816 RepID=A0A1E7K175_9ACTN|nr:hypothetical protein [Streptomyces qinglanensis]OEU97697.1 hypothetical protein AN217_07285 [Streptomyces qinglanensis]
MARTGRDGLRTADGSTATDGLPDAHGEHAADDAAWGAALIRAQLAPGELWARAALVVALCAGSGLLASGIYDYTHVGRPEGLAANLSLGTGTVLVPGALVVLLRLRGRSRDRHRMIELYGGPVGGKAGPGLRGRRAGWTALSVLALLLAFVFLLSGLMQAFSSDPYEEPDPTVYGALLAWAVILTVAGCGGMARARRYRPRADGPSGTSGSGGSARDARLAPGAGLYTRLGARPAAPHRLSPRLDARIQQLSLPAATGLATTVTLVGCALAAATMLLPTHVGGEPLFWTLLLLTAVYLVLLLLELTYYGPRPGCLLLIILAGLALLVVAGNGNTASVLGQRGEWTRVELTEVHHPAKGGPTCDMRPLAEDGIRTDGLRLPCSESEVGETLSVVADPRGEVRPSRSEPTQLGAFVVGWGLTTGVLVSCAIGAAVYGHRRRRELGLHTSEPTGESSR